MAPGARLMDAVPICGHKPCKPGRQKLRSGVLFGAPLSLLVCFDTSKAGALLQHYPLPKKHPLATTGGNHGHRPVDEPVLGEQETTGCLRCGS